MTWTHDPRETLKVDENFRLADFERNGKPGFDGKKKDGKKFGKRRGRLLSELQERLFAEGRTGGTRSVLVIVQGLDTAGKGGIARHVLSMVDPQGVDLASFGVPTEEELSHHFLWRIEKRLPRPGRIGMFDRSHYEDVLVGRVDELAPADEIERRYDEINEFEKNLVDSGTVIIKFALMVSHDEQGVRLMDRLDRPDKRWKFSASDLVTRREWDHYQEAYQIMFDRTSTEWAPWYVLPADRKWFARLAATEILTQTMIDMDLCWPQPQWDVAQMREELADTMSVAALEESLGDSDGVCQAIEEDAAVEKAVIAADVDLPDDPQTGAEDAHRRLTHVKADQQRYFQEFQEATQQKWELLQRKQAEAQGVSGN